MDKLTKDKNRCSRFRKHIIKNNCKVVGLLIITIFCIGVLDDKNVIANTNIDINYGDFMIDTSNFNDYSNDKSSQEGENIHADTNKQNLIYTSYENDLYADNAKDIENMLNKWNYLREDGKKIVYLTFDDGPSTEVTQQILETLKVNNVKATFFILGSNVEKSDIQKELLKEMVMEGHAIGNHGYCHDYSVLYPGRVANPTVLVNDMKKSENIMKSVLGDGFSTNVIRLPGGHMSWNTKALDPILKNGYKYIDWNVLNGDAESNYRTVEELVNRLKETIK